MREVDSSFGRHDADDRAQGQAAASKAEWPSGVLLCGTVIMRRTSLVLGCERGIP